VSENVDIARRFFDGVNHGVDLVELGYLAEDFEWVNPPDAMEPGTRRGPEGWRRATRMMAESFDAMRVEIHDVREAPDGRIVVLGTFHPRGRGSGVETAVEQGYVLSVRDAQVTRFEWHFGHEAALASAGLA
jgi:ketosteroid isomerase-like protein